MTDKRFSVRFSAEGGDRIKAELLGIGEAGSRSLHEIDQSAMELEAGLARMAQEAGRTRTVLRGIGDVRVPLSAVRAEQVASARASADAFVELERLQGGYHNLRASLDPAFAATARLENAQEELREAVARGVITQQQMNRVMVLARAEYRSAMEGVTAATQGVDRFGRTAGERQMAMRNMAFQLNQIGQQGAVTGNYMGALAIQLPDMLTSFGFLGILIGGVAAVMGPLVLEWIRGRDAAEEQADAVEEFNTALGESNRALSRANSALELVSAGGLRQLEERYGRVTMQVRELARELADIELRAAQFEIGELLDLALGDSYRAELDRVIGDVGAAIANAGTVEAQAQIDIMEAQIRDLSAEIEAFRRNGQLVPQGMLDDLQAMNEEMAALQGNVAGIGSLSADMLVDQATVERLLELREQIEMTQAAGDFAGLAASLAAMRETLQAAGIAIDQGIVDALTTAEDQARQMALTLGQVPPATTASADQAERLEAALANGTAFSAQMLANLTNLPGALSALSGSVEGQLTAMAEQNRVLEIQLETGFEAAVAQRQRQLEQLIASGNVDAGRVGELQAEIAALNEAYERNAELRDLLSQTGDGSGEGGGEGRDRTAAELQRELEQLYRETRTEVELLRAEQARLNELYRTGALDGEVYQRAMEALNEELRQAEYPQVVEGIEGVSEALSRTMIYGDSFGDWWRSYWQERAFEVLNSGLTEALTSVAESLGLFGGGGGGGGGLFSWLAGSLFGGGGGVPKYAAGTVYHPGGLAIVGEEGAELVELPGGSRVRTAAETRALLSPLERLGGVLTGGSHAAGGGPSEVIVRLAVPQGVTIEESHQIAGDVAVRIVSEYDRVDLPGRIKSISEDPRARF